MAFLMTDVAAGSNAALQLQQNMAAAPDVQQAQANKMQEQQLKIQQDQANIERLRLSNLVADTGFKAAEASKAKLQELTTTPEWKTADDAQRLRMAAATQFEMGDVENGAKTLASSELYESRRIADTQKQLDQNAQLIGNAYGIISSVPDDKVDEFVSRLPNENRKALIAQVGEDNWNSMTGAEKKEAAKNLMLNAKGQLANQLKAIDVEKAREKNESNERIARIREDGLLARRLAGTSSDKEDRLGWAAYERADQAIDKASEKTLAALNKKVEDADTARNKTIPWWSDSPSKETNDAYTKALKERDDYERKVIEKKLRLATSAPDFPGKKDMVDEYTKQLSMFAPDSSSEDKPKPTEAKGGAKIEIPKTATGLPDKTGVTSSKYTQDNPAKPTSKEEYDKLSAGDYYIADGVLKRKKG
jgi:hypothetical protein